MISQARMDALFVVEAIDVSGDRGVEFGIACEAALVGEFSLQGMEEAFHVGVVLALRGRFMETSSCVRSRCPLYRMRFPSAFERVVSPYARSRHTRPRESTCV